MSAIHLPGWGEPVDSTRLDILELEGACLYLAALLSTRHHLPEDLWLMDAIGWFPGHGRDDLSQLTAWVLQQAAQGPVTFRILQRRLDRAIADADAAWEPRRAELAAEAAREELAAELAAEDASFSDLLRSVMAMSLPHQDNATVMVLYVDGEGA